MLSFATIVYSKDVPLLELQARSFARFVDPEMVASIHVIMNDVDEAGLRTKIDPILPSYGPLRSKVHVVGGDEVLLGPKHCAKRPTLYRALIENRYRIPFARNGGWRGNNGYRTQQALKLGSARVAKSENMVLFDAKNLLLRRFDMSEFFSDSGAARINMFKIESDFHRNWLLQSLDALDVPHPDMDQVRTTTFATPYPVRRSLILALLDEINERYGSVQALFGSRRRPSEFMLLNAYCLKTQGGLDPWYEAVTDHNIGLWPTYSPQQLAHQVARIDDQASLSLGLHNRAISNLPADLRDTVFKQLEVRGVCSRGITKAILDKTSALSA